ncbi:MAG: EAL domain-containing protein [Ruminococcus sp.]|nr:EAL domain-containing protein [Ruminococcus sp.]
MENSNIFPVEYARYMIDENKGGVIIEGLEGFSELTGYTDEDIAKGELKIFDLVPKDDRDDYARHIEKIKRHKAGSFLQHRFVKKNGDVLQVLCFGDTTVTPEGRTFSKITVCNITEMFQAQQKYSRNLEELEAITLNIPGGVAIYEIIGDELIILKANDEYYRMFGYSKAEDHPSYGGKTFRRAEVTGLIEEASAFIHSEKIHDTDVLFTKADGTPLWAHIRTKFLGESPSGNYTMCAVFIDITSTKKLERELVNQRERIKLIAENTDEIHFEYNVKTDTIQFMNCISRYVDEDNIVSGYLSEEKFKLYIHPDDQEIVMAKIKAATNYAQRGSLQFRTKAFDEDYTWYRAPYVSVMDDTGKVSSVYGRLYNIENVQKLKSRIVSDKEEIERLSTTDQVTGLLTRKAFKEKASKILRDNYEIGRCYSIVYSDINDFSYVNDNFGFDSGNQMLYEFAAGITKSKYSLAACRIYSDFFVCLSCSDSRDELLEAIKKVNEDFSKEQRLKYPASDLHISTGVFFLNNPETDITIAIDNADLARRSVKGVKEIPCGIYSERMRKQRAHEQQIAAELKNALVTGQIELFLQPKFTLDTRKIIGAEALSRWRNPDGSYKLPYEFISVLEKVGYIVDLDMYIYEQLLKTMARWQREGYKLFPVSINFSRNHASHRNFVDKLTALSDFYKIDPSLIEIEITESSFMQDFNALYNDMKKLRDKGFKIDIDDFGMGYSSLSVLLNAPVDIVKVDKVFIDNIASNPQARDYVNQICSLINLTRKSIVFEGVETEDQAQILASSGHKMAQGWLFDKAIPVAEFEEKYMKKQKA